MWILQPNIPKEIEPNKTHNKTACDWGQWGILHQMPKSNFFVKDINSDIQGENLLKGINHLNTYDLS